MTAASVLLSGAEYPYRRNSLNLFRLVLAATVLVSHAFPLAGADEPLLLGRSPGNWALVTFFILSGFLITRSRLRNTAGVYIVHRCLRIFPAFLVCLVATAFVLAPIAFLLERGTLAGFLTTATTPFQYVWANLLLDINAYDVAGTPSAVPFPDEWNGSLWTLYYEFLCYLLVWVAGSWALFRRSVWPTVVLFILSVAVGFAVHVRPGLLGLDSMFVRFADLLPFFLGGAIVSFVVTRRGLSTALVTGAAVAAAALIVVFPGWGAMAASPFLGYVLVWLSTRIRQPALVADNDISYGFYIWAFPVQQLLAIVGVARAGIVVYILTAMAATAVLATASWVLVERPALGVARRVSMTEAAPVGGRA